MHSLALLSLSFGELSLFAVGSLFLGLVFGGCLATKLLHDRYEDLVTALRTDGGKLATELHTRFSAFEHEVAAHLHLTHEAALQIGAGPKVTRIVPPDAPTATNSVPAIPSPSAAPHA